MIISKINEGSISFLFVLYLVNEKLICIFAALKRLKNEERYTSTRLPQGYFQGYFM